MICLERTHWQHFEKDTEMLSMVSSLSVYFVIVDHDTKKIASRKLMHGAVVAVELQKHATCSNKQQSYAFPFP